MDAKNKSHELLGIIRFGSHRRKRTLMRPFPTSRSARINAKQITKEKFAPFRFKGKECTSCDLDINDFYRPTNFSTFPSFQPSIFQFSFYPRSTDIRNGKLSSLVKSKYNVLSFPYSSFKSDLVGSTEKVRWSRNSD